MRFRFQIYSVGAACKRSMLSCHSCWNIFAEIGELLTELFNSLFIQISFLQNFWKTFSMFLDSFGHNYQNFACCQQDFVGNRCQVFSTMLSSEQQGSWSHGKLWRKCVVWTVPRKREQSGTIPSPFSLRWDEAIIMYIFQIPTYYKGNKKERTGVRYIPPLESLANLE